MCNARLINSKAAGKPGRAPGGPCPALESRSGRGGSQAQAEPPGGQIPVDLPTAQLSGGAVGWQLPGTARRRWMCPCWVIYRRSCFVRGLPGAIYSSRHGDEGLPGTGTLFWLQAPAQDIHFCIILVPHPVAPLAGDGQDITHRGFTDRGSSLHQPLVRGSGCSLSPPCGNYRVVQARHEADRAPRALVLSSVPLFQTCTAPALR